MMIPGSSKLYIKNPSIGRCTTQTGWCYKLFNKCCTACKIGRGHLQQFFNKRGNVHLNIPLAHVYVTNVDVQKQRAFTYSECVPAGLSYPACKAHVLYYVVIWPLWLQHILPHYLINGTIFRKMLLTIICIFIFSKTLSEAFLFLRGIQRDSIINIHRSSCKALVILVRF